MKKETRKTIEKSNQFWTFDTCISTVENIYIEAYDEIMS